MARRSFSRFFPGTTPDAAPILQSVDMLQRRKDLADQTLFEQRLAAQEQFLHPEDLTQFERQREGIISEAYNKAKAGSIPDVTRASQEAILAMRRLPSLQAAQRQKDLYKQITEQEARGNIIANKEAILSPLYEGDKVRDLPGLQLVNPQDIQRRAEMLGKSFSTTLPMQYSREGVPAGYIRGIRRAATEEEINRLTEQALSGYGNLNEAQRERMKGLVEAGIRSTITGQEERLVDKSYIDPYRQFLMSQAKAKAASENTQRGMDGSYNELTSFFSKSGVQPVSKNLKEMLSDQVFEAAKNQYTQKVIEKGLPSFRFTPSSPEFKKDPDFKDVKSFDDLYRMSQEKTIGTATGSQFGPIVTKTSTEKAKKAGKIITEVENKMIQDITRDVPKWNLNKLKVSGNATQSSTAKRIEALSNDFMTQNQDLLKGATPMSSSLLKEAKNKGIGGFKVNEINGGIDNFMYSLSPIDAEGKMMTEDDKPVEIWVELPKGPTQDQFLDLLSGRVEGVGGIPGVAKELQRRSLRDVVVQAAADFHNQGQDITYNQILTAYQDPEARKQAWVTLRALGAPDDPNTTVNIYDLYPINTGDATR